MAHISDVHFGRTNPAAVAALREDLEQQEPNLVLLSGDLTQRARAREFAEARAFIDSLSMPVLAVPGNHDVPLYNVLARFAWPLRGFKRYISNETCPMYRDEHIAVLGLNSARSLTFKEGRISGEQMQLVHRFFASAPPQACRILFAHHPLLPPEHLPHVPVMGSAKKALRVLETARVDLLLTGHLHATSASAVGGSLLVVQAGTAASSRTREEANMYNVIVIEGSVVTCEVRRFDGVRFHEATKTVWPLKRAASA